MRQLYVCSKPILGDDGQMNRHLLGILTLKDNGEFQFRYTLNGKDVDRYLLPGFPNKKQIYDNESARLLLDDYLPSENDTAFMKNILMQAGMSQYNEWDWLKIFESADENTETRLYETIPDDVIRHDKIIMDEDGVVYDDSLDDIDEYDDYDDYDSDIYDNMYDDNADYDYDDNDNEEERDADNEAYPFDDIDLADLVDTYVPNDVQETVTPCAEARNDTLGCHSVVTTVTRTVTRKIKKRTTSSDFITPPPENPYDMICKRLVEREKKTKRRTPSDKSSVN